MRSGDRRWSVRAIPTAVHGVLDYLVAILLLAAPWLLGFARGGSETYVTVGFGVAVLLYSLVTDYEPGAWRLLAMPGHLALDLVAGLLLVVSPWLFGFADIVWWPHLVVGLFSIVASLTTRTVPER